jgi:hypothetical protein
VSIPADMGITNETCHPVPDDHPRLSMAVPKLRHGPISPGRAPCSGLSGLIRTSFTPTPSRHGSMLDDVRVLL